MSLFKQYFIFCTSFVLCWASYHEQYKVPFATTDKWESYIFNDREFIIQSLPVNWENAKILCRGHHNASLAILDTKDKADFLAEALAESQFVIDSVWVGARRVSAEDPAGYRWPTGSELRRTALDVAPDESHVIDKYPAWLNRTHVPVPEGGADCVALERVSHDNPVFLDLPCQLDRAFVCERDAVAQTEVAQVKSVRCRTGLYRVFDGRMDWNQAAAYCILQKMSLANIATMRCLKKLGLTMLKSRPSIESAWIGGRGALGHWSWLDTGLSILTPSTFIDTPDIWPPLRDRNNIKQSGCLQLDRHTSHPPVFMEARCERKMQFICYQGIPNLGTTTGIPSDDLYSYVLVRQQFYWQHAYDNCLKMNGRLASVDNKEMIVQLLLVMGENKDEPVNHVWVSGRLNITKDSNAVDNVIFSWYNPASGKRIADPKSFGDSSVGIYTPPWLDDEFTMDSPCLNLDRQDHLNGLVYGLPCDTAQSSICIIEKSIKIPATESTNDAFEGA